MAPSGVRNCWPGRLHTGCQPVRRSGGLGDPLVLSAGLAPVLSGDRLAGKAMPGAELAVAAEHDAGAGIRFYSLWQYTVPCRHAFCDITVDTAISGSLLFESADNLN